MGRPVKPGTTARMAPMKKVRNSTRGRAPNATIITRPPGRVMRTISRSPRIMSGKRETPFCDAAMSKASSSRSRA